MHSHVGGLGHVGRRLAQWVAMSTQLWLEASVQPEALPSGHVQCAPGEASQNGS
jgi:hypothetical protein